MTDEMIDEVIDEMTDEIILIEYRPGVKEICVDKKHRSRAIEANSKMDKISGRIMNLIDEYPCPDIPGRIHLKFREKVEFGVENYDVIRKIHPPDTKICLDGRSSKSRGD